MTIMKHIAYFCILLALMAALGGCASQEPAQVAATTLPVYQFTTLLCENTPITVTRLVTEQVSCLHDYTLTVSQMRAIESAGLVVISGAGLEEFMAEALERADTVVDASAGIALLEGGCHHDHEEEDAQEHHHDHELDSHIWLSPANARVMAANICAGLCSQYPAYADTFRSNLESLDARLGELEAYGTEQLSQLATRELITFHDGFSYLAHAYDLEILEAIEEESGSETSARDLIDLIELVEHHGVKAIFTETNGSDSAASIIARETGAGVFTLDMAMAGEDYFDSMYRNIDTLKEALS